MSLFEVHAAMSPPRYSGMEKMKSFQIATKNYDGGSSNSNEEESSLSLISVGGRPDAFALYSNPEIRMDRLLFRTRLPAAELIPSDTSIDNIMDTSSSMAKCSATTRSLPRQPPRRRVTRLSFEVHPSLLDLDPLLVVADGELTRSPTSVSFDECESTTAK
jgi:hypothetical protein